MKLSIGIELEEALAAFAEQCSHRKIGSSTAPGCALWLSQIAIPPEWFSIRPPQASQLIFGLRWPSASTWNISDMGIKVHQRTTQATAIKLGGRFRAADPRTMLIFRDVEGWSYKQLASALNLRR